MGAYRPRPTRRTWSAWLVAGLLAGWSLAAGAGYLHAEDIVCSSVEAIEQALRNARPGTVVKIAPGTYSKRVWASGPVGSEGAPVTITAQDPARPPLFKGCDEAMHLSGPKWVVISHLVIEGMTANGMNIDDGGDFNGGAHHIVIEKITVRDIGPKGNFDGIKLSGLVDFVVRNCEVTDCGDGGQGIDMVGCRQGVIADCKFTQTRDGGEGVQCKGGTRAVIVKNCDFRFAKGGRRGVNVGGSTGLPFFRPKVEGYESKQVIVLGCRFDGCPEAPVTFVTNLDSEVVYNTMLYPQHFILRILQESSDAQFKPCANGVFANNLVVYKKSQVKIDVNVGGKTAPESFTFRSNFWYAADQPGASKPDLPVAETGGVYGIDPQLSMEAGKEFTLATGSPAAQMGAQASAVATVWKDKYSRLAPWAAGVIDAELKNRPVARSGANPGPAGTAVPNVPPPNPEREKTLAALREAAYAAIGKQLTGGRTLELMLPYDEQVLQMQLIGADPKDGVQAKVLGAKRLLPWGGLRSSQVAGILEALIGEGEAQAAEHWYLCAGLYSADGNAVGSSTAATKALELDPDLGEKLKATMSKLH